MNNIEKMKKTLIFLSLILFIGCLNTNNQNTKHFFFQEELPKGWINGRILPYQPEDHVEKNMISQYFTCYNAMMQGDYENASIYLFTDALNYYRENNDEFPDDEAMAEIYKEIASEFRETQSEFDDLGINYDIYPVKITKKIQDGESLIYVFDITSILYNENKSIYSSPDTEIGISFNRGKNWVFFRMDNETPNLLRTRFSQKTVDEVMGY